MASVCECACVYLAAVAMPPECPPNAPPSTSPFRPSTLCRKRCFVAQKTQTSLQKIAQSIENRIAQHVTASTQPPCRHARTMLDLWSRKLPFAALLCAVLRCATLLRWLCFWSPEQPLTSGWNVSLTSGAQWQQMFQFVVRNPVRKSQHNKLFSCVWVKSAIMPKWQIV